jgi:hypothetical protein
MRRRLVFTLVLLAAAACNRRQAPDPTAMVQRVMGGLLIYPMSARISMSAGEDAAQVTLTTPDSIRPVAEWFRRALTLNGWTLQSDLTGNDGTVTISATHGKRPLWITLRPTQGAPGTTYTMVGALVADSEPGAGAAPSKTQTR